MPVIEVSHLTKEYRLGSMLSLGQTLRNVTARLSGSPSAERPLFKALDDVSFGIERGEVVGIIGHNGAGKSTLLKMLARISTPTHGSVRVDGRIAPLIEVGAGFVPDFTGRENVYLNGSILGMTKKDIDRKFDEIVDFAEMAEFIDTPVKRYSSGMQIKLAFAIATSVESEILIVDEVLAVGDLAFQRKCFDRMEDVIKHQGRTVLLVSHNLRHIERICSRTILLERGSLAGDGNPQEICDLFFQKNDEKIVQQKVVLPAHLTSVLSSGESELLSVKLVDSANRLITELHKGDDVTFRLIYKTHRDFDRPVFVLGIHTTDFIYLATCRSGEAFANERLPRGIHQIDCSVANFPLNPGVYALRLDLIVGDMYSTAFHAENVNPFKVVSRDFNRAQGEGEGFLSLETSWKLLGPLINARPQEFKS